MVRRSPLRDTLLAMDLGRAMEWLDGARGADGWGYRPDEPAAPEPTALCRAAGVPAVPPLPSGPGVGAWGALVWPWAAAGAGPGVDEALRVLLAWPVLQTDETAGRYSGRFAGWSWVPGTFSWVEPTAWALLSLEAAGLGAHPRAVEGRALLADRQCVDGGWNTSAPDVFGVPVPAYQSTTAMVLAALPAGHPAAAHGWGWLRQDVEGPSPLAAAWSVLAAARHGEDPAPHRARLAALQAPDGSLSGRVDRTALAVAAVRRAAL